MNEYLLTLISLVSICALIIMRLTIFRSYQTEKFRQDMFALRDELFDEAFLGGKVTFSDPCYRHLRATMNGYIRFAHRVTFTNLLFTQHIVTDIKNSSNRKSYAELFEERLKELPPEQRAVFDGYHQKMHILTIERLFKSSISLMLLGSIVSFLARLFIGTKSRIFALLLDNQRIEDSLNTQALREGMKGPDDCYSSLAI